jgi:hypothetical protein
MDMMTLYASFSGPNLLGLMRQLAALPALQADLIHLIRVDDRKRKLIPGWVDTYVPASQREIRVEWGADAHHWLRYDRDLLVAVQISGFSRNVNAVAALISDLPFTVASFGSMHDSWFAADNFYAGPSFGEGHFPLGWGCAFKGEGHRQLASRRWLEFGPWRLLRGAGDTSLVQFHDIAADAATALAQARPGHERMGISDIGGYLQRNYVYTHHIGGRYSPATRKLEIVVHGREVTQVEMRDAAAVRRYQDLGPENPVDSIAYIFMEEGPARAHLHELWLRELECWALVAGREQRLDAAYQPAPTPPAWAQALEAHASEGSGDGPATHS